METINTLYALFAFIGLLLITAGFINGIFITTRGETVVDVDGVTRDEDAMIFYPLYKLICKQKDDLWVRYTDDHLQRLVRKILKAHPALPRTFDFNTNLLEFNGPEGKEAILLWKQYTADWLEQQKITAQFFDNQIIFYDRHKQYVLPEIIRKPTVQCIKCMPSFWGSLVWWPTVLLYYGFEPDWQFAGWIMFCFTLSFLCTFFYKLAKS